VSGEANRQSSNPSPIARELARRVKLVVFDADGVLTDAGVYLGTTASGEAVELKRFDIQDGVGMRLLMWSGLHVAIVSGRVSQATELRARELGVDCFQEADARKIPAMEALLAKRNVAWEEVAMLGDDIPDLAVLRRVGLPAAVANATPQVKAIAVWESTKRGGHGAVREFCDALLRARGCLDEVVERYVNERSGGARTP
jgi:3-deoxy-D-manno-octulosonate 8-phosphate phosphatase (KDO 8-P phosphatase)